MHRDLKPENLLLKSKTSDSDIIVADFGLATRIDIENILFKRCGTPGFVAPEVLLYKVKKSSYIHSILSLQANRCSTQRFLKS